MTTSNEAYETYRQAVSPEADPGSLAKAFFLAGWEARGRDLGGNEKAHIVDIQADGSWTMQHPLNERADGNLFNCAYHPLVRATVEDGHVGPGKFAFSLDESGVLLWDDLDA